MSNIYNVINWGLLGEGKQPPVPVPTDSYLVMEYFCDNWAGGGEWPPNYSNIYFRKNLAGAFSKVTELLRTNYQIWAIGEVQNIEDIVNLHLLNV